MNEMGLTQSIITIAAVLAALIAIGGYFLYSRLASDPSHATMAMMIICTICIRYSCMIILLSVVQLVVSLLVDVL